MKRLLTATFFTALFTVILLLLCTGCMTVSQNTDGTIAVDTLPPVTTEEIAKGTLFVRCSQPEENFFTVQFVAAVPTNRVDYVGFEACIVYPDGTRSSRVSKAIHTLYQSIENEDGKTVITSEDFGIENGYLFSRALERISTLEDELSYEIGAFYVIGDEKHYTAKQIFSVKALLEEHILSDPKPIEHKSESEIIEAQKWLPCTDDSGKLTHYLGASLPDTNGNLKMFACFPVPSLNLNTVGMRYKFTKKSGENAGVSTSLQRAYTYTLYDAVITEDETLTIENFGLTEGYLAVIAFSQDVNYVERQDFDFDYTLVYSHNALEKTVAAEKRDFAVLRDATVITRVGVQVLPYTYIPTDFREWNDFSEADGNATGDGKYLIRLTNATNSQGIYKFKMQIASAIPTRFASRVAYVCTAYDKDGNIVGTPNVEIAVSDVYPSLLITDKEAITSEYFGEEFDRGYIASMTVKELDYDNGIEYFKIESYYVKDGVKTTVASLTIDFAVLRGMISVAE